MSEEHEWEHRTIVIKENCFLLKKNWRKPDQKTNQISFSFLSTPKQKALQCFNYCWPYFQLMRIQQLETESKEAEAGG